MKKIILASKSPRRKELLEKAGFKFEIVESDYKEDMTLNMELTKLAEFLSRGKAEDVARNHSDSIIIAADTFVTLGHHRLGKPHTPEVAKETLQKISGQIVEVITGYTIIDTSTKHSISKSVTTKVIFKNFTQEEIDTYIVTGESLDKAGAFAIQGKGAKLIEKIEGDRDSVIGLPIKSLIKSLDALDAKRS